jgi:PAS domain S-box-containing protein
LAGSFSKSNSSNSVTAIRLMVHDAQPLVSLDSSAQPKRDRDPHKYSAARIAGTYLIAGVLWIGLSDMSLAWSGGLTATGFLVAVGKGLVFVLLSTCLVFGLCRREYRNSARTMDLLRAVVDGTTDAVFVKDREGRYQLVNDSAARFIGLPAGEVLGRDDRELFDSDEAERLMASDRAIMASRGVVTQDETLTSGGVTRTYHATKAPYFDATGNVAGLIGISRNITDRALVEATLRETDSRLREAQRIAKLGSWSWNPLTDRVWWSDAEFELFGLTPGAVVPSFEAFLSFLHPEDRATALARVEAIQAGADVFANDMRVIRPDGKLMWIHSQGRVTRDIGGKLIRVEGTDQDITAQRLAREAAFESERRLQAARIQADAANRAKSEFLANMSHEIRTPLTAILGFAEVLRGDDKYAAPKHWIENLETISSAGKHLLSIINDILDLSKIEADKLKLELIETPLIEVLSEVKRLLSTTTSVKGLLLNTKLSTPLPDRILCDPTRLRQILMNLVGNAVKFTESGSVVINACAAKSKTNDCLIIEIEDTGKGIDSEQTQSLFQAFEQADNSVSRKYGGTGLGLTICRRLAMLMGGDVTLVRTEIGVGSCFRLQLPLIPIDGAVLVNSIETKDVSADESKPAKLSVQGRILLAEDGLDNQRLITFFLAKAGATVDVAENGQIAIEMLNRSNESNMSYDLLLTDMQMPIIDGYLLASTLRSQGNKIPIVALTAHALAEDRQKCLDAGCDDYLSKPVEKHSLIAICAKWIAIRR